MRTLSVAILLVASTAFLSPRVAVGDGPPQLLPPASEFELTLREDPSSKLPLGPSCGDEAGLTLSCRAFVVTLKNVGAHTVHLSRISCQEPFVSFASKDPNSPSSWWAISSTKQQACTPLTYVNLRLKPGESTEFATRLVSPLRPPEVSFGTLRPGNHTMRAQWSLQGCTEDTEGSDCLTPLQTRKPSSLDWTKPDIEYQTPVTVLSNEIEVQSPILTDLGSLKFGFEVSVLPNSEGWNKTNPIPAKCAGQAETSVECTVFHYAIRNLGDRAVRIGRWTCSDYSIIPEYHSDNGEWKSLESKLWGCKRNFIVDTPILPGETDEGTFTIPQLKPSFDTAPLYPAGDYHFRFRFHSIACIASPDGSFCLVMPKDQPVVTSNEVVVHATEFIPPGKPEQK